MREAALVFPNQLFDPHPCLNGTSTVFLAEEPSFFTTHRFHRQKLIFHRAGLKRLADRLEKAGREVRYLESADLKDAGDVAAALAARKIGTVRLVDPSDDALLGRLRGALRARGIALEVEPDPHFLTSRAEIELFARGKERFYFTKFYIAQRKRLDILLKRGKPAGGKWSFDPANRKRLPASIDVPAVAFPAEDEVVREARRYVRRRFPDALGADEPFLYPTDPAGAERWLADFVKRRLGRFGDYEDAISAEHDVLFHSLLSPLLNAGLLSPRRAVEAALAARRTPMNSLEGFVRQVIGWREFVRLIYLARGGEQRTRNHWGHARPLPAAFYDGTTGIGPVDHVIRRVLRLGWCHHIERLMILGNFMLLCEIRPDDVYRWFMELFVDAYDWVMVPNVYGMSQHADGGMMTTKPYVSGSAYVRRMGDFEAGPWCGVWDALYWRFIDRHARAFERNPRMSLVARARRRLGAKLKEHLKTAEGFLEQLYGAPAR